MPIFRRSHVYLKIWDRVIFHPAEDVKWPSRFSLGWNHLPPPRLPLEWTLSTKRVIPPPIPNHQYFEGWKQFETLFSHLFCYRESPICRPLWSFPILEPNTVVRLTERLFRISALLRTLPLCYVPLWMGVHSRELEPSRNTLCLPLILYFIPLSKLSSVPIATDIKENIFVRTYCYMLTYFNFWLTYFKKLLRWAIQYF